MNGLGDLVYYTLKFTGISFLVSLFTKYVLRKEDCGCQWRRRRLNELVPFRRKVYVD